MYLARNRGRVLFDGHDLTDATLASSRGQIGLVFQDTFIFDTTLRENIGLSKPSATHVEIAAAAQAARLESYAEALPARYDTVLGERGVRMSGGQRLAIAQALVRNLRILILDEATSALDAATERERLDTLAEVARGRTTVSITRRLAFAAKADTVRTTQPSELYGLSQADFSHLLEREPEIGRAVEETMGKRRAALPAASAPAPSSTTVLVAGSGAT